MKPTKAADTLTVGVPELLNNGSDQEFRDFMAEIFAAAATLQALRRSTARKFDLSSSELALLVALSKLPTQPTVKELADHLHLLATNVTADLGSLARLGYATKTADPHDARAVKIALTPSGRALVKKIAPALRMVNDKLFSSVRRDEMKRISSIMKHVVREGRLLSQSIDSKSNAGS